MSGAVPSRNTKPRARFRFPMKQVSSRGMRVPRGLAISPIKNAAGSKYMSGGVLNWAPAIPQ
jgi:hypothetical protein